MNESKDAINIKNTKKVVCPYCGAEEAVKNWWAEFVERQGGGNQRCKACNRWFEVTCKITRRWASKPTNERAEDGEQKQ